MKTVIKLRFIQRRFGAALICDSKTAALNLFEPPLQYKRFFHNNPQMKTVIKLRFIGQHPPV